MDGTEVDETIRIFDLDDTFGDNIIVNEDEEWSTVSKFLVSGCGCTSQCCKFFDTSEIVSMRCESDGLNYWENHSNPQDLAIMAQIATFVATGKDTMKSHSIQKPRELTRTHFQLKGLKICARMYFFAMAISNKKFRRLKSLYLDNGLSPPLHGHHKRIPKNTASTEHIRNIVNFLKRYAELHAIYLPGRYPNQKNYSVKLLASCDNITVVYRKYVQSCESTGQAAVGRTTFRNTWQTFCGDIITMKPKNDLGGICPQNYTSHSKINSLFETDEAKLELIAKMKAHLEYVAKERKFYNESIEKT